MLPISSISACEHFQSPGRTVLVQRDPPGPELTTCPPETPMPATFGSEAERYAWATDAILSGRACRSILAELAAWALRKL